MQVPLIGGEKFCLWCTKVCHFLWLGRVVSEDVRCSPVACFWGASGSHWNKDSFLFPTLFFLLPFLLSFPPSPSLLLSAQLTYSLSPPFSHFFSFLPSPSSPSITKEACILFFYPFYRDSSPTCYRYSKFQPLTYRSSPVSPTLPFSPSLTSSYSETFFGITAPACRGSQTCHSGFTDVFMGRVTILQDLYVMIKENNDENSDISLLSFLKYS